MTVQTYNFIVKEIKTAAYFYAFSVIVFGAPVPASFLGRIGVFICYIIGWTLFGLAGNLLPSLLPKKKD